ncbi:MAG: excinuclease ABC subunit UvrC [Candidatus Cloacimonadia bacterium]
MTTGNKIQNKLKLLPENPGVYLMKNDSGKIIYVGKSKNLKKRVSSYFTKNQEFPQKQIMVSQIKDFDYIVTRNEVESLILEANLIKQYKPRFNVALKDDKKYPYIKIDIKNPFPRAIVTRRIQSDGSKYFGPYTEAHSIRNTLNTLEKIFRLRTCTRDIPKNNKQNPFQRPCLNFQINKCDAPCIGNIDYPTYQKKIQQVILFLRGNTEAVISELQKEMKKAAEATNFEEAAKLRDQIQEIQRISTKQVVTKLVRENLDAIGISQEEKLCCVVLLKVREGRLIKKEHYFLEHAEDEAIEFILARFIPQYYTQQEDIPKKILVNTIPEDVDLIAQWLHTEFVVPHRGDKYQLLKMANQNAFMQLDEKRLSHLKSTYRTVFVVKELKDALHLSTFPRKIAAFDVSNLQGKEAVASMVFFDNGKPKKSQYRRYKIKNVRGINDYEMIEEAVTRYLSHLDEENVEEPDMILIDGGKGQLAFAQKALKKYHYDISLFAIAKRLEEVFTVGQKEPIVIARTSQALRLLQRIRDEAHRFAITYHKTLRDRKTSFSELDSIPGIGEKRKLLLLKKFHSVVEIKKASVEELEEAPGISKKLAKIIYAHLHKTPA